MDHINLLFVVAAALIRADGSVLVQQRPPDRSLAGLWEFPGGKVEPGETPAEALVRELREELGVTVASGALRPLTFASEPLGSRHLLMLLYRVENWLGEPAALDASAISWATLDDLRSLQMPPADRPFVDVLAALKL